MNAPFLEPFDLIVDMEIKATVDEGITPYVPKSLTSGNPKKGLYDRRDFVYIEAADEYQCPAGERLPRRMVTLEGNKIWCATGVQTAVSAHSSRSALQAKSDEWLVGSMARYWKSTSNE